MSELQLEEGGEIGTRNKRSVWSADDHRALLDWLAANDPEALGRFLEEAGNKGSVWRVASKGYAGAHYATFSPSLVEPCVRAGSSEYGACASCGAPWRRVTAREKLTRPRPNDYVKRTGVPGTGSSRANTVAGVRTETLGWEPTCKCGTEEVRPCVVLDPFCGSGTVGEVCLGEPRLRRFWGIDLSEQYLRDHAVRRIEAALLTRPRLMRLVPPAGTVNGGAAR